MALVLGHVLDSLAAGGGGEGLGGDGQGGGGVASLLLLAKDGQQFREVLAGCSCLSLGWVKGW